VAFEKDFATRTAGLGVLEAWLAERQVQLVAMEATGVYWKPVLYALESRTIAFERRRAITRSHPERSVRAKRGRVVPWQPSVASMTG